MKFFSVAIVSLLTLAVSAHEECSKSQFKHHSHKTGHVCLPRGGSDHHSSPPHGKDCPRRWEWNSHWGLCVPKYEDHWYNPKCDEGHWDRDHQCCTKPTKPGHPTPSGRYGNHWNKRVVDAKIESRNWRSKTLSCATGEAVCNVSDSRASSTWACVDIQKDTNFCGGCGLQGAPGQDCSSIPNTWNVACMSGECKVLTCEQGFRVSRNGKSCVATE